MREIEMREIINAKCPVCGCRNKLHTEIIDSNNEFLGYTLKCCGCGNTGPFLLDYQSNGQCGEKPSHPGKSMCIQPSRCMHKDCPLYGTWPPKSKIDADSPCMYDKSTKNTVKPLVNEVNVIPQNPPRFL